MEPTILVELLGVFIAAGGATKFMMNGISKTVKSVDARQAKIETSTDEIKATLATHGERLARVETCVELHQKE